MPCGRWASLMGGTPATHGAAHLPGLALPGQPSRSMQARYRFRCTESSCPPSAGTVLKAPPFDLASSMPSLLSRRSSSPIRSGRSRMCPTSSTRRTTAARTRALSERSVNSGRRHPCHQFPRGGEFSNPPGGTRGISSPVALWCRALLV